MGTESLRSGVYPTAPIKGEEKQYGKRLAENSQRRRMPSRMKIGLFYLSRENIRVGIEVGVQSDLRKKGRRGGSSTEKGTTQSEEGKRRINSLEGVRLLLFEETNPLATDVPSLAQGRGK